MGRQQHDPRAQRRLRHRCRLVLHRICHRVQGAFYGGQSTYTNNPDEPGFIPYDQLTQQIVLGWVFDGLGTQKAEIEATLTAKVEKQLNPTTANGVPWNTAPAPQA